uniref:Uncharacterized protein n=1 Tax=Anopheles epiroticus TaxID=199890 RepID=A0A182P9X1_9DIPT
MAAVRCGSLVTGAMLMLLIAFLADGGVVADEPTNLGTIDLNSIDINKLKDDVLADLLPPEFKNVTLPKLEDIQKIIKDKCSRVAGSDASYEEAEQAAQKFGDCMQDLVDFSDLQEEIKKAKPTGDLDTVFNKYCRRRSAAIECIDTFSNKVDICLENDEKESKVVMVNIVHGLLNFVCHKDGDQIALFIAEEGPECFADQKEALIDCVNGTMSGYLKDDAAPVASEGLPKLVMGKKQCDEMSSLQECMVQALEGCKESTPANLVESLFKFVRRETPCANITGEVTPRKHSRNVGELMTASQRIITSSLLMALVAKLFTLSDLFVFETGATMADVSNAIDVDALRERLPANLPIPSMEEVEKMLRDKCNTAGAPADAYDNAKEAAKTFVECGQGLIDIGEFQQEVEAAKPTGDLDTVFNKYCRKRSTLIECVNTFANAVDPCLEAEEKVFKTSGLDIFKNLLNFVCHKDGDQIAPEKGPECFLEQKNDLVACMNETFSGYVPDTSLTAIPKLVIGPKQCEDFTKLQNCMVRELEQCDESTPANLVESLFRYVRKGSPCAVSRNVS